MPSMFEPADDDPGETAVAETMMLREPDKYTLATPTEIMLRASKEAMVVVGESVPGGTGEGR